MGTLQNVTVGGLLVDLGVSGYGGVALAADEHVAGQLDIAVTPPAWAILGDGVFLSAELVPVAVDVSALPDGTYSVWVDLALPPAPPDTALWTVEAGAPSARAVAVGTVTVVSGAITATAPATTGLRNLPLAGGLAGLFTVVQASADTTLEPVNTVLATLVDQVRITLPAPTDAAGMVVVRFSRGSTVGMAVQTADSSHLWDESSDTGQSSIGFGAGWAVFACDGSVWYYKAF